jgi:8-oxo-dGTP diphosphatase
MLRPPLTSRKKIPETDLAAAGGVLVRRHKGKPEIAVIHRPRHEDWSLPKGKLDPGESFEEAALREVHEETGIKAELGEELPPVVYKVGSGKKKLVRYWLMAPAKKAKAKAKFKPNDEVDELRWLRLDEAVELLDYDHDRDLVRKALKPRRLRRWFA